MISSPPPNRTWWRRLRRTARWRWVALVISALCASLVARVVMYLSIFILIWPLAAIAELVLAVSHVGASDDARLIVDGLFGLTGAAAVGGACGGVVFRWLQRLLTPPERHLSQPPWRRAARAGACAFVVLALLMYVASRVLVL